ncbi:phospholipase D-like domain-containing protein [Heyndrickxia acidiproducens]|uniref:phospholipase D-like domain-containing protein n=1 Tax=Heyndrickxia acidiproducens TaxID=1121084 RepID=UPI00036984AE|nr:phospholipase D-like domain-containing protein [Heyndrickxia acidiproducens]
MFLLWAILICAALILLLIADFKLGKKNSCSKYHKRQYPVRNGRLAIYTNGHQLFAQYFSDIKQATSSIYIMFYIVKNDAIGRELFQLLAEKAREGIEVKVLLDWAGSRGVSKKMMSQLKRAGATIAYSHRPSFPCLFFSLQQRNHRKITVIDKKIGYLGGFNVGKDYINGNPKLSPWRDYHLSITGGSIQDLEHEFILNWNQANKHNRLQTGSGPSHGQEAGDTAHRIVPTEGIFLEKMLCTIIDQARSTIFIGSPYFVPSPRLEKKLEAALERGVRLTILTPKTPDHVLVKEAAYCYFRTLLQKGAHIYQYRPGFYHAKIVVVDQAVCDIGSANFDRRSFLLNHEVNCLIYDPRFIKEEVLPIIETDLSHASLLTLHDLNHVGFPAKMKEWAAKAVADLL